ncbi:agamous-like MADS-box protein AGL29 [Abrus precatorius]|uniref:Agamous-like MADS-box protein AGL29 n=1 Tax=Abrus precatorius TaxID=3816 RepID=A0A8B8KHI1_ABRPR|nr:agamous-like MADS-box protein AGL29 [Abrus precatorius]
MAIGSKKQVQEMGRRKIEIAKIKDTNTRQVTFSKRRTGLFKKGNEISILCGVDIAIVVFSPGNKPYSFGHPGVDAVAAQYLQIEPRSNEAQSGAHNNMEKLNQELAYWKEQLHMVEKKGASHFEAINQVLGTQHFELQQRIDSLQWLRSSVRDSIGDIEAAESLILLAQKPVRGVKNRVPKKKGKN